MATINSVILPNYATALWILFTVVTILCAVGVEAKESEGVLKDWMFTNNHCFLMTRYGTDSGKVHLKLKYSINFPNQDLRNQASPLHASLLVVDETGHRMVGKMAQDGVKDIPSKLESMHSKNSIVTFVLDLIGSDVFTTNFDLPKSKSLYFFYVCDHDQEINKYYNNKLTKFRKHLTEGGNSNMVNGENAGNFHDILTSGSELSYSISLTDGENLHHSIEEQLLGRLSGVFALIYLIITAAIFRKMSAAWKLNAKLDHPSAMLFFISLMQLLSTLFKTFHAALYSSAGQDVRFLDFMNQFCFMLSDSLLCAMLLLLSKGYGISVIHIVFDFEVESSIAVVLMVCRYIWTCLWFSNAKDNHDIFHMYDGLVGYLEIANLVVFYLWFLGSLANSQCFKKDKLPTLKKNIFIVGTVYFCIRPALLVILLMIPRHHQLAVSLGLTLVSHSIPLIATSYIIANDKGYRSVAVSGLSELPDSK